MYLIFQKETSLSSSFFFCLFSCDQFLIFQKQTSFSFSFIFYLLSFHLCLLFQRETFLSFLFFRCRFSLDLFLIFQKESSLSFFIHILSSLVNFLPFLFSRANWIENRWTTISSQGSLTCSEIQTASSRIWTPIPFSTVIINTLSIPVYPRFSLSLSLYIYIYVCVCVCVCVYICVCVRVCVRMALT